ncbi:MAG: hypothetical protein LBQ74_14475 [Prevotella sp.]|jgi:hypothetical protein|nr:hypothetical protein [Prevotella sp.]
MNDEIRKLLEHVLAQKMETKYAIKQCKEMQELTGKSFQQEIDKYLDYLNRLDRMEQKLRKQK